MDNLKREERLIESIEESNYLFSFGYSKITVKIEVESKMNFSEIYFDYTELNLNYCFEIFKYWNKHTTNFTISGCSRATKIVAKDVRSIYDKYLKNEHRK